MSEPDFSKIRIPRPWPVRLKTALKALRGVDAMFDRGAQFSHEGQVYTLAKLYIALWIETDDRAEAQRVLKEGAELVLGRVTWEQEQKDLARNA